MHSLLAYLDAGSGSMILQVILGGTAALAVSMKLWWRRILTFLHIRKDEPEPPEAESHGVPAEAGEPSEPPAVAESSGR